MRPHRWVIGVGLVGIVGLGTGCKDKELRYYLGENGRMYKWEQSVQQELCLLEKYSTVPDDEKRCTEPPSITPPPKYPPK
jgi:hypothetical protein